MVDTFVLDLFSLFTRLSISWAWAVPKHGKAFIERTHRTVHGARSTEHEAPSNGIILCIERELLVSHLAAFNGISWESECVCVCGNASKSFSWSIGICQFAHSKRLSIALRIHTPSTFHVIFLFVFALNFFSFSLSLYFSIWCRQRLLGETVVCRFVSVRHWFWTVCWFSELTFCFDKYWLLTSTQMNVRGHLLVSVCKRLNHLLEMNQGLKMNTSHSNEITKTQAQPSERKTQHTHTQRQRMLHDNAFLVIPSKKE